MAAIISVELPVPPSTNNLYVPRKDGKGRAVTSTYAAWKREAAQLIMLSGCPRVALKHVRVEIEAPLDYRRDIDNLKPVMDILTLMHIIKDDRWVDELFVKRIPVNAPMVVRLFPLADVTVRGHAVKSERPGPAKSRPLMTVGRDPTDGRPKPTGS